MTPHETILAQMQSLAAGISGVAAAMPTDGRDEKQMATEAARRRDQGATVFCRLVGGERVEDAPRGTDRTEATVAWAIAVSSLDGRRSALETAYALWALLYRSASGSRLSIDWLDRPLMYRDWALVYDSPTCAIVDLVMTTRYDLARIPDLPDGSPLPVPTGIVRIQYSADASTWTSTYADGHVYARWSVDGGATYGPAIRFQGAPGSGADAEAIRGVPVSETAPAANQVLAYDPDAEQYVPTDPAAAPAEASEAEALAGTETALRSWSPSGHWTGARGYLLSLLTEAGTVLYRSVSGLAALTLRSTIRPAGPGEDTADDTSLATEAATRAGLDARLPLSLVTTAGDRIRATGSATVERVPALVALPDAPAGDWTPALKAGSHHTVTRTGIWTGIAPTGLEIGEGCSGVITGAYATTTTGVTADAEGDLDAIAAASVGWLIWREATGYRMVCWERA